MTLKAIGCHVFAGGFTMGVKRVAECDLQLESHGFGIETARDSVGVDVINCSAGEWPSMRADVLFGNPRCTGFSCITSGYDDSAHGAWSKPTQDIHDLVNYGITNKFPIIVWESVQQAYTASGKDLIDWLVEHKYRPAGYRVVHLLLNAASFGNAQQRKRYFCVAYPADKIFNVEPPKLSQYYATTYDPLWPLRDYPAHEAEPSWRGYDADSYVRLTSYEKECLAGLPNGWNLNMQARFSRETVPLKYQAVWDARGSEMPFSMHCIQRLQWTHPFPTIHSSAARWIHPWHHRPLTVRELAKAMGWGDVRPFGKAPIAQIAKGIVPAIGEWLMRQVEKCLNDSWGNDDYESSYSHRSEEWLGRDTHGILEKVFDLTQYAPGGFDIERFDNDARIPKHRFNVDSGTSRLIRPWKEILQSARRDARGHRLERYVDELRVDLPDESPAEA